MVSYPKDITSSIKVAFFIFTKRCNARKQYDFKILFLNVGSSFNELFLRICFFLPEAILHRLVYFLYFFYNISDSILTDSLYLPNWVVSCQKIVEQFAKIEATQVQPTLSFSNLIKMESCCRFLPISLFLLACRPLGDYLKISAPSIHNEKSYLKKHLRFQELILPFLHFCTMIFSEKSREKINDNIVKFSFSEKATKICVIFLMVLKFLWPSQKS